jgi:LmbE family N-acetylglucosaminyl deacetylase
VTLPSVPGGAPAVAPVRGAESSDDGRPRAAVVVAHPDDETLWCGGYLLTHPEYRWRIVTLCRSADPDRAPRFRRLLEQLGAEGCMADLDDGPEQVPLPAARVQFTIASLLANHRYDLILTHGPQGEYTWHRRHSECCQAVVALWRSGVVRTAALWMFAYEDGNRAYLPRVRANADRRDLLSDAVWRAKRGLITGLYGFTPASWEARTAPREEGFYCLASAAAAERRIAPWKEQL